MEVTMALENDDREYGVDVERELAGDESAD